ncbi:MAG: hypothetical protein KAH18_04915 [Psychromonas sp.]|nr:hypothetical protein [Psychromonas sp.]
MTINHGIGITNKMAMTFSQKLNKYWRVLATGINFVFFGIGSLVLTPIISPVLTLTIKDIARR